MLNTNYNTSETEIIVVQVWIRGYVTRIGKGSKLMT